MTRTLYGSPDYREACEKCGEKFRSLRMARSHEAQCKQEAE